VEPEYVQQSRLDYHGGVAQPDSSDQTAERQTVDATKAIGARRRETQGFLPTQQSIAFENPVSVR
jgi:hypothetical protein